MEVDLIPLIAQFGFPIVVCLWFMLKTEKIITRNTQVIEELSVMIKLLCSQNGKRNK
jgi:hypothetical protein